MIDQKILDRANAAKRLKSNPDFILIMSAIDDYLFDTFKAISIGDEETLKTVHQLAHGFKLVGNRIDKYQEIANYEVSKDEDF